MYNNYVPGPFPFYPYLEYQNYRRAQCRGDKSTFKLVVKSYGEDSFTQGIHVFVPAFQIKRDDSAAAVDNFKFYTISGALLHTEASPSVGIEELDPNEPGQKDALVWPGGWVDIGDLAADVFYLYMTVTAGAETWYSEVFFLDRSTGGVDYEIPTGCDAGASYIRLIWSTSCIISSTIHSEFGGFQVFLPVNLGQPEYNYNPEYEPQGDGSQVKTFETLAKRFTFFIVGPEYLADALVAMQMFSNIGIDFPNGDFVTCRDVEVEVEWEQACFARITVSFTADLLVRTACCQPPE